MISCCSVRACCCPGLLREHESQKTPRLPHTCTSVAADVVWKHSLHSTKEQTTGNAQKMGEGDRVTWKGVEGGSNLFPSPTITVDWYSFSVKSLINCISDCGGAALQPEHTDGSSVLTPALLPDTHHMLTEQLWGCGWRLLYGSERAIRDGVVTTVVSIQEMLKYTVYVLLCCSKNTHQVFLLNT